MASEAHVETLALREQFDTAEQQKDASTLGMWIFLITEIMFFGGMFLAYTIYRSTYPEVFAIASSSLNAVIGAINTESTSSRKKPTISFREPPACLRSSRRDMKVKTLFGRVRPIPDINSKNPNQRGFAERTAVNTPLQGTAADLIKIAMIRIDEAIRERDLKSRMTLQVHDELVFEVPEAEVDIMRSLVREYMEKVHELAVPLQVDLGVGPNWRDLD